MANQQQPSALPPKAPAASWTPDRVTKLMECLEAETKSGTYTDNGFKGAGWKAIQINFNEK